MRQLYILVVFVMFSSCGTVSQKNTKEPITEINKTETLIESYSLDSLTNNEDNQIGVKKLGIINSGEIIESSFYLKNNTTTPLVILNINGSCGCLTFNYDKKPLSSGDTRKVVFVFDTKTKNGMQFSTVKVKTDKKDYILKIESEIK